MSVAPEIGVVILRKFQNFDGQILDCNLQTSNLILIVKILRLILYRKYRRGRGRQTKQYYHFPKSQLWLPNRLGLRTFCAVFPSNGARSRDRASWRFEKQLWQTKAERAKFVSDYCGYQWNAFCTQGARQRWWQHDRCMSLVLAHYEPRSRQTKNKRKGNEQTNRNDKTNLKNITANQINLQNASKANANIWIMW